jgi:hypothetical protein
VGKPEGRRLLGRHRRKREDDIKMEHREIEWGDIGFIDLAQVRAQRQALVITVMNFRVP